MAFYIEEAPGLKRKGSDLNPGLNQAKPLLPTETGREKVLLPGKAYDKDNNCVYLEQIMAEAGGL